MVRRIIEHHLINFYEVYDIKNPKGIMIRIILTLGLYIPYWLYQTNYEFAKVDDEAPHPQKAIILILGVPIVWYLITLIISKLILPDMPVVSDVIKILGWSGFTFLSLQYIYEFCKMYGRMTKSSALMWYLAIYPGYYSVILLFFDFYYTIPLIFFPIICIPAMQSYLNFRYYQVNMKRIAVYFNCMYQGGHFN